MFRQLNSDINSLFNKCVLNAICFVLFHARLILPTGVLLFMIISLITLIVLDLLYQMLTSKEIIDTQILVQHV